MSERPAPVEPSMCTECLMYVEPPTAFHPWLYCWLVRGGVINPAKFLEDQHFVPDPNYWGEDAPAAQREACE